VVCGNVQCAAHARHLGLLCDGYGVRVRRALSWDHDVGGLQLCAQRRDCVLDLVVVGSGGSAPSS
jgi:hypothetical protein